MANPFEHPQEKIYTEEEIIDLIAPYLRGAEILPEFTRIKEDGRGIYFYEVRAKGEKSNEYSEYVFQRKGEYADGNSAAKTRITVVFYRDDEIFGGEHLADLE